MILYIFKIFFGQIYLSKIGSLGCFGQIILIFELSDPEEPKKEKRPLSGQVGRLLNPDVFVEIWVPRSSFRWSKTRRPTVTDPNALCDLIP